jgi:hypothetical protein
MTTNEPMVENLEPQAPKNEAKMDKSSIMPVFWTVASIISLIVNFVLIIVVLALVSQIFTIKRLVAVDLLGGLYNNFALMDQSRIKTNIQIDTKVPAKFKIQLDQNTNVTLTEDTPISNAVVSVATGGLVIDRARSNIILPAGTQLPIHLVLTVPVDKTIPVTMDVPVDIALNKTDLHLPFIGLQQVVAPYYKALMNAPSSWSELFFGKDSSQ